MTQTFSGQRSPGTGAADSGATLAARLKSYWADHYARVLLIAVFIVPSLLAAFYFALVASDRYVSETRFIVRSVDKPAAQGAAAYLQDFGILRANDDAYAIQDFIHSRDLMHTIMRQVDLRKVWNPPGADFYSRYGSVLVADSDEALFRYYVRNVQVEKNLETGITAVRVLAYTARDAQAIARIVLQQSEARVNDMNARARADSLAVAERTSMDAAQRLAAANVALTRLRQSAGEIDPEREAGAAVQRNSALEREIADLQVTLQTMRARAPANPAIPAMAQRLAALNAEAAAQRETLTGPATAGKAATQPLAGKIDEMSRLETEALVAAQTYETAQKQLSSAQEEFSRQQVFVEEVASPSLPDVPQEPRRWRYFFTVALLTFWSFLILYLLVSGSREHLNLH